MTEDQIVKMTMDAVGALMAKLPTQASRNEAIGLLLMTSYNLLRNPPIADLRRPH